MRAKFEENQFRVHAFINLVVLLVVVNAIIELTHWQVRPTLKLPHQLTKNPLADKEKTR